ncbi:hypothetical protein Gasu2_02430 [Galdieria sulphuraria]|uniref:Rhodanese-related sulfurtransferase n=1 Tax=Galdieria sulphuraria TaxID=130081 RepID=M2VX13_GALSU|nr:rhodanese-related sulfurtransferase [Galdieria sulphuraria]EME27791.1 rhodanese-related sulfurtransferase [Galdieria sulphuraria]GJD05793.1 hypothetical protein Gasu2_02430 [Galdieria sulphuraria]|eukprot:XP_005704311.1 rhodanese-related sulfurtransferase [Galdieria sulphuraria]
MSINNLSRRKWIQYSGIALLSFLIQKKVVASHPTEIEYISPKQAYERLNSSKLVDVRSSEEYKSQHIEGSISIPLSTNEFVASFQKQFPFNTHLIIVCQTGMRSSKAAQQLIQSGYSHVSVIRGGLNEWNRQGLFLTSS